ncbi:MAG: hypothetical protein A3F77_12920 [Betaproteobacteria bacterium RIFCSPLOWO2_12_FULL_67_28]|nr:MAG: hypothetical protein A3I65_10415 [Betaproteobacteria bacterium RIFCSPLOWO2_02_FULL_68_150]OGA55970.1 MAG: hypothetical protein A3F77_12920 [Betaproteobacteria bacterium RIFCSPLOWO2_12_FULL_67_28]
MDAAVDLFWSFRSPYSYLAVRGALRLEVSRLLFGGTRDWHFGEDRIDTLRWRLEKHKLQRG